MIMKTLIALAALAVGGAVWAVAGSAPQIATHETVCVAGQDLTDTVTEFQELPFVRGQSHAPNSGNLSLVIFANPDTGTFTIVERAGKDLYCILAVGSKFEPVPRDIQDRARRDQGRL
jgi:hypothetical protein